MTKARSGRTERPILPATAARKGLGSLRIGSLQSRAAARLLVIARQGIEAEDEWDRPLSADGLAEYLDAARKRDERGELLEADRSPIYIPPGKENTERGRLATRLRAAAARMKQYEAR